MKFCILALFTLLFCSSAHAQGNQCRTATVGASTPNCASEAFVTSSVAAAGNVSGPGSSVDKHVASFNGTSGTSIQDSGLLSTTLFTKIKIVVLTSPSGTYTPSTGLVYEIVEAIGAGAGAGGTASAPASTLSFGSGGCSGAYTRSVVAAASVSPSVPYTIGTGGPGGAAGNNAGTAGGATNFASGLVTANGGGPGAGQSGSVGSGGVCTAAAVGTGDFKLPGNTATALASHGSIFPDAPGASTPMGFGIGGLASASAGTGLSGTGLGSGGAGGVSFNAGGAAAGGAGQPGEIIITEFINQ